MGSVQIKIATLYFQTMICLQVHEEVLNTIPGTRERFIKTPIHEPRTQSPIIIRILCSVQRGITVIFVMGDYPQRSARLTLYI